MEIERDEFLVTFDAASGNIATLLDATKAAGFPATLVSAETVSNVGDDGFFEDALAKARREKKPVVIDFTAAWCVPCQRMLRETFPDPEVAKLLAECVFVKVDTDEHPGIAKRYGVVGLPDIRFLSHRGNEVRRFLDFQSPVDFTVALETFLRSNSASLNDDKLSALSAGEVELKEAFNRDAGKVRLVLVLSPT